MDTKLQLTEKLRSATNILVTVSNNPSVDQLAACIAMTLWLNKSDKHATAVFSGDIPNTLEFLQPEATIEKTTDSLRDFIIALDKSKADKLRYKVEDRVVKIFITPYRTNLSADDLEFSQGDFNVDAIVAIGVTKQDDLDQAIVSHGRILHDAVVTTINTSNDGDLGSVNWHDSTTSSLSEMVYDLCQALDAKDLDPQIATALLTGIVAETERFSNSKTTPNTMSVAAALMGAGANQQLVANKLEENGGIKRSPKKSQNDNSSSKSRPDEGSDDGTLEIEHEKNAVEAAEQKAQNDSRQYPKAKEKKRFNDVKSLPREPDRVEDARQDQHKPKPRDDSGSQDHMATKLVTEPPQLGGMLTANSRPDDLNIDPVTDPLSLPAVDTNQLLTRDKPDKEESETSEPQVPSEQPPAGPGEKEVKEEDTPQIDDYQTLSDIEEAVDSPHLNEIRENVDDAFKDNGTESNDDALAFNPADFVIEEHDDSAEPPNPTGAAPPPIAPPPVVPPDFLPPEPPTEQG